MLLLSAAAQIPTFVTPISYDMKILVTSDDVSLGRLVSLPTSTRASTRSCLFSVNSFSLSCVSSPLLSLITRVHPISRKSHLSLRPGPKNSQNLHRYPELDTLGWLHEFAPHFAISGDAITVIEEPSAFYATILEQCSKAKRRVVLASLYLGVGELEQRLVRGLLENMRANPELSVDILLDFQRGTRGTTNSRTTLKPLLDLGPRFNLSLYHTPNLRGAKKRLIPARWNELIGLQHMKVSTKVIPTRLSEQEN